MDGILINLERAGCTISGVKSQFCIPKLRVMGFIYDILKRYPNTFKIIKIIEWFFPNDIAEVRAFIKITVYYRVFVKNFAFVATPIYSFLKVCRGEKVPVSGGIWRYFARLFYRPAPIFSRRFTSCTR
jgi:hypothetical protein